MTIYALKSMIAVLLVRVADSDGTKKRGAKKQRNHVFNCLGKNPEDPFNMDLINNMRIDFQNISEQKHIPFIKSLLKGWCQ